MSTLITAFASTVVLLTTLCIAALLTFFAVRGSRNKYVPSASLVVEKFSIDPEGADGSFIRITGRHKGLLAWILTNLGISTRVELTVTEKDWTIREGSLAGMRLADVPLKRVRATICGYQRSVLALFFAAFFGLNGAWALLGLLAPFIHAVQEHSEYAWEVSTKGMGIILFGVLLWLVLSGIAGLIYYFSKRVAFAVEAGQLFGVVFKRSLIGNRVIDIETAEQATALLNRLVQAAVYDIPLSQVPAASVPPPPEQVHRTLKAWMIAAGYIGLFLLAAVLSWYGDGVRLEVATVPGGASVWLDNQYFGTSNVPDGVLVIKHALRQNHVLQVQYEGFQPFTQTVRLGKFESSHEVTAKLKLMNYPITVFTAPAQSHVTLDGQDAGTTNDNGSLVIPKVDRGTHHISVSHDGYGTASGNIEVYGRRGFRFDLLSEAEAARQGAAARQRETSEHLDRGRALYKQGQYSEALAECDAALKVNPSNAATLALKKQIEQTRKILGQ